MGRIAGIYFLLENLITNSNTPRKARYNSIRSQITKPKYLPPPIAIPARRTSIAIIKFLCILQK